MGESHRVSCMVGVTVPSPGYRRGFQKCDYTSRLLWATAYLWCIDMRVSVDLYEHSPQSRLRNILVIYIRINLVLSVPQLPTPDCPSSATTGWTISYIGSPSAPLSSCPCRYPRVCMITPILKPVKMLTLTLMMFTTLKSITIWHCQYYNQ